MRVMDRTDAMDLNAITAQLKKLQSEDDAGIWPVDIVALLHESGCRRNVIPTSFGGIGASPRERVETYEAVAAGSLTAALILTQHDAAAELLSSSDNRRLAERLLPGCAAGELLLTVGISQLTTSTRGRGPALRVEPCDNGFDLSGFMPWVTSAPNADFVVTGGVLADQRQILACVSLRATGLNVQTPVKLLALDSSLTCEVRCDRVRVESDFVVREPCEKALARRAPVKSLTVSSVGMGVAQALLADIQIQAQHLDDASSLVKERILPTYQALRHDLFAAADQVAEPDAEVSGTGLRCRVNELLVRLSATLMTLSKGSGYLSTHRTQRLLREAAFFLIWSAPPAVQIGTLSRLWA